MSFIQTYCVFWGQKVFLCVLFFVFFLFICAVFFHCLAAGEMNNPAWNLLFSVQITKLHTLVFLIFHITLFTVTQCILKKRRLWNVRLTIVSYYYTVQSYLLKTLQYTFIFFCFWQFFLNYIRLKYHVTTVFTTVELKWNDGRSLYSLNRRSVHAVIKFQCSKEI